MNNQQIEYHTKEINRKIERCIHDKYGYKSPDFEDIRLTIRTYESFDGYKELVDKIVNQQALDYSNSCLENIMEIEKKYGKLPARCNSEMCNTSNYCMYFSDYYKFKKIYLNQKNKIKPLKSKQKLSRNTIPQTYEIRSLLFKELEKKLGRSMYNHKALRIQRYQPLLVDIKKKCCIKFDISLEVLNRQLDALYRHVEFNIDNAHRMTKFRKNSWEAVDLDSGVYKKNKKNKKIEKSKTVVINYKVCSVRSSYKNKNTNKKFTRKEFLKNRNEKSEATLSETFDFDL